MLVFTRSSGLNPYPNNLLSAPAIIFDQNDYLHDRYLEKFFRIKTEQPNYHTIPSVQGFREFVRQGLAYALIPEADVWMDIEKNRLVNLFPDKVWEMPLYFHHWQLGHEHYNDMIEQLTSFSIEALAKFSSR